MTTRFGSFLLVFSILPVLGILSGCGSAYSGMVGTSGLGAAQYIPSVYVVPGNEDMYQSVLPICRQVANNRQMTAAQESQLKTITGAVEGTVEGAASGLEFASVLDAFGDIDKGDSAMIGAGVGLATSLVSSFASGAKTTAAETKKILLRCLRVASNDGEFWRVLE